MGFYGDSDIGPMLKDLGGNAVTAGSVHSFGALDLNDEIVTDDGRGGQVIMRAITLEVQTSAFTHNLIATDAAITVDGVNYVVIKPLSHGDGATTKLLLRKA